MKEMTVQCPPLPRKGVKMRRLLFAGLLLLAGCRSNLIGPFGHRTPERVDDPIRPIPEQRREGRARLALPEEYTRTDPPGFGVTDPPQGVNGRY
jgi:hypothetical protein